MESMTDEDLRLFKLRAAADGDTGLAYEARLLLRQLSRLIRVAPRPDAARLGRIRYKAFQRYARRRRAQAAREGEGQWMADVVIRECKPDEFGDDDWAEDEWREDCVIMSDFERAAYRMGKAASLLLDDGGRSLERFNDLASALAAFKAAANIL